MNKPTAQELWERITVKILKTSVAWTEAMGDSTGKSLDKFDKHEAELHVLVRSYAQAYHEEQIKDKKERLLLCADTSICDCGEPYRESDLHDLITEL